MRRAQAGFTMIELMTVMVIAGILLVMAAPAFNDLLQRRRLEGQANELAIDLGYAKSEAVARNRNVALFTGGGGTCYTIAAWTTGTGSCDCTTAFPSCTGGPVGLKTVTLTNAVTVTDGLTFDFEPVRGALQSSTTTTATVTLGSRNLAISVTGYGRVTPFNP